MIRTAAPPLLLALLLALACADDGDGGPDPDSLSDIAGDAQVDDGASDATGDGGPDPDSLSDIAGDAQVDDGASDATGDGDVGPGEEPAFHFGVDPAQGITAAPFPNDLYRGEGGGIALAPLADDPVFGTLAKASVLERLDAAIADREGFGVTAPAFFWVDGTPDLTSFEDRVHIEALTGPEAGSVVPAQVFAFEPGGAVGVMPAWGYWLMPGSTYAVLVEQGVTDEAGIPFESPIRFQDMLTDEPPESTQIADAREDWAGVRQWLADEGRSPEDFAVGTVFTTQEIVAYGQRLFDALDAYTLEPPTNRVRWDAEGEVFETAAPVEGEDLAAYFGTPAAPFELRPGRWGSGTRQNAALLDDVDEAYEGGALHAGIGRVLNGSVRAPALNFAIADGEATNAAFRFDGDGPIRDADAMIPFSLFLCEEHLADPTDLPVAIFTHGGTSIRADAIAFATLNCLSGVATIAPDLPFHGGRVTTAYVPDEGVIAPTVPDEENAYTGLTAGDPGFLPDHVGDGGAATDTVAPLFALGFELDPGVVEANLLTISLEQYALLRLLREGDWSLLQDDLSFDPERVFHQSLSFGTSFTTTFAALADDVAGVVNSVGSGMILSANLPTAPANANLAAGIVRPLLGLQSSPAFLIVGAWRDPVISMTQWLMERGDPLPWAPYVLRHRPTDRAVPVFGSGNSWDGTLYSPAQLSWANAYGMEPRSAGEGWTLDGTIPGSATVDEVPFGDDPVSDNVTYGGRTHTATMSYFAGSCHSQVVTPLCARTFEPPYPPITPRDAPFVQRSPICELHHATRAFTESILAGGPAQAVAPTGSCEDLYGP